MFAWDAGLSMLELEQSLAMQDGWSPSLLLSDLSWSHLSLGLSLPVCTLEVEGIVLVDG